VSSAVLLGLAIVIVGGIVTIVIIALQFNSPICTKYLSIGFCPDAVNKENEEDPDRIIESLEEDLRNIKSDVARVVKALKDYDNAKNITIDNLKMIDSEFFATIKNKDDALNKLNKLAGYKEACKVTYMDFDKNYRILKIEVEKNSIPIKKQGEESQFYRRIQILFHHIGMIEKENINENRDSTLELLIEFQKIRMKDVLDFDRELGWFGLKTLEAIKKEFDTRRG
jgi:septal ring factor EnvC (AmiA/AmiB activator)